MLSKFKFEFYKYKKRGKKVVNLYFEIQVNIRNFIVTFMTIFL